MEVLKIVLWFESSDFGPLNFIFKVGKKGQKKRALRLDISLKIKNPYELNEQRAPRSVRYTSKSSELDKRILKWALLR